MKYLMGFLFWLKNILLWLDQGLNTLLLGDPDETLSRRAGRARAKGKQWGCLLCKVLDWVDPRHCQKSIEGDDEYEGKNSVSQMVARWQLGLPATWTPKLVVTPHVTIVGEAYSHETIEQLKEKDKQ